MLFPLKLGVLKMSYHFFFHDDHINIYGKKWSKRHIYQIFLKTEIKEAFTVESVNVFL